MPELPEVETVCQELRKHVKGKLIKTSCLITNLRLRKEIPKSIETIVSNTLIQDISRRGKYILIHLKNGYSLVIHLGMSGKILIKPVDYNFIKHDHMVFYLENLLLVYNDARRFGLIDIVESKKIENYSYFSKLGVEPLSEAFTPEVLIKLLKSSKANAKAFLMNSENIVGIGNIYASEILFKSGISPFKCVYEISEQRADLLYKNIVETLIESIHFGGSTLKDYSKVNGESGYFQNNFKVYGKEAEACVVCDNEIKRVNQNGRSTFFCEMCQRS